MDLVQKVESEIASRNLLQKGDRLVLAVSGGIDSMVLLHVVSQLAPAFSWPLVVAHYNHQLRGQESDKDEEFVRQQAEARQIQFYSSSADARQYAQEHGLSIEMGARALRHRFFAALAQELSIPNVALAHQADDQVENLWIHLLRGSASEALGGMKWVSPSPADASVKLIRPLLDLRRKELEAFASEQNLPFRIDPSNQVGDFLRNRVRIDLLPLLARDYQPAIAETSLRIMDVLGQEKEWLNLQALEWLRQPARAFTDLHPALQRAILHLQILQHELSPSYDLIEHLRLKPEIPISVRSGEQLLCAVDGKLYLQRRHDPAFRSATLDVTLDGAEGSISWDGLEIHWSISAEGKIERIPNRELFDADSVGHSLQLRHWQPGDLFQPIGMNQSVKLQDLFTNQKIPSERRRALLLAQTSRGQIFWVESLRIGELAKVTPSTRRFLHWHWFRAAQP